MTMPERHRKRVPAFEDSRDSPARSTLSSEPPIVLATYGLTKSFGGTLAVDHLDLTVRRGDVFGFLGPNGAGKTTTIRMIVGLDLPDQRLRGWWSTTRCRATRSQALKHIGGFVEVPAFYGNMSARRNLRLMGSLNERSTKSASTRCSTSSACASAPTPRSATTRTA